MAVKETRRKSRKRTNTDKLRRKLPTGDLKMLDGAAAAAASKRQDYMRLQEEGRKLEEVVKMATEDYKEVKRYMKSIEEEEFHKIVLQVEQPRWSWW